MKIPQGATHSHECYGTVNYYKLDLVRINSLDNKPVYDWFWWDGVKWRHEPSVNSRQFKLIKS